LCLSRSTARQTVHTGNTTGCLVMKLSHTIKVLASLTLTALALDCAGAPPSPLPQAESLLVAAGFKTVVASTDKQLQTLPTLPAGQVTVVTQTGKNFFVYPDMANNRVYVGTEKEYQTYLKLRAQNNLAAPDSQASYFKQDAAMRKADARDGSVPWELWPSFDGLGW
jgi:hypothetical protein